MAGPEGPYKRVLRPGKRPRKASKVRAEIKKAKKAKAIKPEPIEEIKELPEHLPPHAASVVVDSALPATVGGPAVGGALPRTKAKVSAAVKRAADRAEATSAGKEPPPVSTKGVDPALVAAVAAKEAEEAKEAAGSVPPTATEAPVMGPGGALVYGIPRVVGEPIYTTEFDDSARLLCANGANDHDLADFFKVTLRSIYRWKAQHVSFRAAIFVGNQEYRDAQDDNVERSLYQRATGYVQVTEKIMSYQGQIMRVQFEENVPADVAAAKLWLANRRPDKWRVDPDKGGNDNLAGQALEGAAILEIARRMGQVLIEAAKAEKTIDAEVVDVTP
jgi:hypothetical protein